LNSPRNQLERNIKPITTIEVEVEEIKKKKKCGRIFDF
jgi:hypothetical protein